MPVCAVRGCNNRTSSKSEKQLMLEETHHITFHLFPKNADKRKLWIDSMGLDEASLPARSVLCSLHFKSDDFDRTSTTCVRLKADAVPCMAVTSAMSLGDNNKLVHGAQEEISQIARLNPDTTEHSKEQAVAVEAAIAVEQAIAAEAAIAVEQAVAVETSVKNSSPVLYQILTGNERRKRPASYGALDMEHLRKKNSKIENVVSESTTEDSPETAPPKMPDILIEKTTQDSPESAPPETPDIPVEKTTQDSPESAPPETPNIPIDKTTQVSPSRTLYSPRRQYFRGMIRKMRKDYQREIRLLKMKQSRGKKKIAILRDVLKALKDKCLLRDEQLDVLSAIGPSNAEFLKRLKNNKSNGKPVAPNYSAELRSFAQTLHYFSPMAYRYIREKFNSRLPHPKALTKWYQSVNREPGFSTEALGYIKSCASDAEYALIGALILYEISLSRRVEYDGYCFRGFVDAGPEIASDNVTLAKDALVLLAVGVNHSLKIPIAYFLVDSINGEQRCNLIRQSLILLHENGLPVISVTCKVSPLNLTMARELRCNFSDPAALKTSFRHPITSEDVYVLFDPCHMLELVRNTLGDYGYLINVKGQHIDWTYIEQLHPAQEAEPDLSNKPTEIRLAAQTFSLSVATAIFISRSQLPLSQLKNSEATEEFVRLFNDLFDIFNSRNLRQKYFKRPINPDNRDEIFAKLSEARKYILGLAGPTKKRLVCSERKMGFLGFLASIESLKGVCNYLFSEKNKVEYLPMYNLSQDHVQLFFGTFGRRDDGPDVRQFKKAFDRMLIPVETNGGDRGNSITLKDTPILSASSYTDNPELIVNHSTPSYKPVYEETLERHETACVIHERAYALSLVEHLETSELSDTIIAYVAGFVVRHLRKSLQCGRCVMALSEDRDNQQSDCYLIAAKYQEKLYRPSNSVIEICKAAQRVIRFAIAESYEVRVSKKISELYLCSLILSELNVAKVFRDLNDHSNDQSGLDNHRLQLIRCVILNYVKMLMFNVGKKSIGYSKSERHYLNKIILLKGH